MTIKLVEKKIKWGRKGKGKGKGKGREKEWGRRGKGTVNGGKALFSSLGKGEGKALIVLICERNLSGEEGNGKVKWKGRNNQKNT